MKMTHGTRGRQEYEFMACVIWYCRELGIGELFDEPSGGRFFRKESIRDVAYLSPGDVVHVATVVRDGVLLHMSIDLVLSSDSAKDKAVSVVKAVEPL